MEDKIRVDGDVAEVPVGEGHYAIIDAADVSRVDMLIWKVDTRGDPYTHYPDPDHPTVNTTATLKKMILGQKAERGHAIKNLDGNQLNCRRSNLRMMSLSEARALDKKNFGQVERKPRVVTRNIRKMLGMQKPPRPDPTFKKRILDEPTTLLQAKVPMSTAARLKEVCGQNKRSMSDVTSEAILEWLDRRSGGP